MLAMTLVMMACARSDADLEKAVADKLVAENVGGIAVGVKDGVATLSGEVEDDDIKRRAERAARGVEGVLAVRNEIVTRPLVGAADAAAQAKADELLRKTGCSGARAEVRDGMVILSGTVPALKYVECLKVIDEAGLGKLDNGLLMGN